MGIVILAILLSKLDINQIIQQLKQIDLCFYLYGLILFLPMILCKSIRWRYLLHMQSISITKKEALVFYTSGLFVGSITPGRFGEIIRVFYIKNKGYSTGKAFFSVFVDRLSDFLFLVGIGYLGMIFFFGLFTRSIELITLFFLTVAIAVLIYVSKKGREKGVVKWFFDFLLPEKNKKVIIDNVQDFIKTFKILNFKYITFIIIITTGGWLFYYLQMFFLSKALGIDISFLLISAIVSVVALAVLIPISIAGIGTRDAALALLFSQVGISKESAVAFSSLILLTMVINTAMCSIGWFFNKQEEEESVR
tara:strand:+ start:1311 stop:2234 length:924 start_codon:yes stop_codon:yes gene_type:complete